MLAIELELGSDGRPATLPLPLGEPRDGKPGSDGRAAVDLASPSPDLLSAGASGPGSATEPSSASVGNFGSVDEEFGGGGGGSDSFRPRVASTGAIDDQKRLQNTYLTVKH